MTEKRERPDNVSPAAWAKWNGPAAPARAAMTGRVRKPTTQPAAGRCPAGESPAAWAVKTGRVAEGGPTHAMLKQHEDSGRRAYAARFAEAVAVGAKIGPPSGTGAAGGRAGALRPSPRAEAPARRQPLEVRSHWDSTRLVQLDVYGTNPLVEDARQSTGAYASAIRESAPPTMFADGDLPVFTASGVDPRELLKVPWYARHAVAAAPSAATVLEAIEHFAHDAIDWEGKYQHNGALDYTTRVSTWLVGRSRANDVYDNSAAARGSST
jgi:hypothetical protein